MYSGPSEYAGWTTRPDYQQTHYPYPTSATASEYSTSWSVPSTTEDDPSMFHSTSGSMDYNYESTATTGMWTPTVNPISTSTYYPSTTHSMSVGGFSSTESTWGSSDQTPHSTYSNPTTYSSERPSLIRSISADHGSNTSFYMDFPSSHQSRMISTAPVSPTEYNYPTSETASATSQPTGKSRSSSKSTSKKSDSKSMTSSKMASSKRKLQQSTVAQTPISPADQEHDKQLIERLGHMMPPYPATQDPRVISEHIRREAWRICKANAQEMHHRRVQLEQEHTVLEHETQQMQANIALMREAIEKENRELAEAVAKAERLGSDSGY